MIKPKPHLGYLLGVKLDVLTKWGAAAAASSALFESVLDAPASEVEVTGLETGKKYLVHFLWIFDATSTSDVAIMAINGDSVNQDGDVYQGAGLQIVAHTPIATGGSTGVTGSSFSETVFDATSGRYRVSQTFGSRYNATAGSVDRLHAYARFPDTSTEISSLVFKTSDITPEDEFLAGTSVRIYEIP